MQIVSQRPVSFAEAKALLAKRQKDGEMGYEQQNTLSYLEQFSKLNTKESDSLVKELIELGLSERQAVNVADLNPRKEDEVKTILLKDSPSIGAEEVKAVLKAVKKFK